MDVRPGGDLASFGVEGANAVKARGVLNDARMQYETALAVKDVGKHVGWDMSDGWGAVIAALVAIIGSIVVGWMGYRAGRRQVSDQATAEHRAWRRQNRHEAYKHLLAMADEFGRVMDQWRFTTTRSPAAMLAAVDRLAAGLAGVRLAGPESMHTHGKEIIDAAGQVYAYTRRVQPLSLVMPIAPAQWVAMAQKLIQAEDAFVVAAAKVLDDPEL